LPLYYNHKPSGRGYNYVSLKGQPLFVFGHGLSYTSFEYGNLRITPQEVAAAGEVDIRVDVRNVGNRDGEEVVQLYVHDQYACVARPVKELKGFKKTLIKAGEKSEVAFSLAVEELCFYDQDMNLVVEPGKFDVMVGGSSASGVTGCFEVV
jgi:beta-glucosidase